MEHPNCGRYSACAVRALGDFDLAEWVVQTERCQGCPHRWVGQNPWDFAVVGLVNGQFPAAAFFEGREFAGGAHARHWRGWGLHCTASEHMSVRADYQIRPEILTMLCCNPQRHDMGWGNLGAPNLIVELGGFPRSCQHRDICASVPLARWMASIQGEAARVGKDRFPIKVNYLVTRNRIEVLARGSVRLPFSLKPFREARMGAGTVPFGERVLFVLTGGNYVRYRRQRRWGDTVERSELCTSPTWGSHRAIRRMLVVEIPDDQKRRLATGARRASTVTLTVPERRVARASNRKAAAVTLQVSERRIAAGTRRRGSVQLAYVRRIEVPDEA